MFFSLRFDKKYYIFFTRHNALKNCIANIYFKFISTFGTLPGTKHTLRSQDKSYRYIIMSGNSRNKNTFRGFATFYQQYIKKNVYFQI